MFRSATPSLLSRRPTTLARLALRAQAVCKESGAAIAARSAERRGNRPPAPPAHIHPLSRSPGI
ncbi:MAG: hypothetical protein J2P36_38240 [Ktedonobacteraceae bacterium]|nr:hypothetical protein [Ktedonobacteraceae bacterium]